MKKLYAFLLVSFLGLNSLSLAQHDMSGMQMDMNMSSNDMLSGLEGKDFEVSFLSIMIAHHEGAVGMANWILERTDNPEIEETARSIISKQTSEIQQMTAWLQDWYGQGVDEHSRMMMQTDMAKLDNASTGVTADRAFLETMIPHHQSAISMATLAQTKATHPELRELADAIILEQTLEIRHYRNWLAEMPASSQAPMQGHHDMASHGTDAASPYLDQLESSVRGLSQEEVDGLLAGEGMGYARSAELNGYPGPRHTLDLAKELNLTTKQQAKIEPIFDEMKKEAVTLGQEIVAAEATLSQSFADGTLTSESLQVQLEDLAKLYAQLRQVHLQAHLEVTPLLTQEQVAQYQVLRGYAQN